MAKTKAGTPGAVKPSAPDPIFIKKAKSALPINPDPFSEKARENPITYH